MEGSKHTAQGVSPPRHFREQSEGADAGSIEIGITTEAPLEVETRSEGPLEVNMTNEPGGDPYNHTGSFKRIYR